VNVNAGTGNLLSRTSYPATAPDRGERLRDPKTEQAFAKILQDYQPDAVHFQVLRNLPLGLIEIAKDAGVPTVVTVHDYFLWCVHFTLLTPEFCHFETNPEVCAECLTRQGFAVEEDFVNRRRAYVGWLLTACDRIVFPSTFVRDVFRCYYRKLHPQQCVVIENGLYTDGSIPLPAAPQNGVLRVAFLGNFLPHKGNEAFRGILRELHGRTDMEFHVFGHMYEQLDVDASNVHVHGGYDRRYLIRQLREQHIDVILLLSKTAETFSYTLSESILAGAIIIASDIGALRDRVAAGQVGFLVEHDNPVPRSCVILKSLAATPDLVTLFKRRVLKAADSVATYEQMSEQHLALYRSLSEASTVVQSSAPVQHVTKKDDLELNSGQEFSSECGSRFQAVLHADKDVDE
jgi:glycosyltransferase involved in cell wall biosynthesis